MTETWQLSRRGATWELEAEFKFQRRRCKLSFLLPPRRQNAPESLLAGYVISNLFHSDYFVACHNRCWWSILQNHIRSFDGNTATRQSHKTSWLVTWKSCLHTLPPHSQLSWKLYRVILNFDGCQISPFFLWSQKVSPPPLKIVSAI